MIERSISHRTQVDRVTLERWIRAYSGRMGERSGSPNHHVAPEHTRSGSDSQAAWQKWHRGSCTPWFSEAQMPWYGALERARVECLAGGELPGVARNLQKAPTNHVNMPPAIRQLYHSARSLWGLGFERSLSMESGVVSIDDTVGHGLFNSFRRWIRLDSKSVLGSVETNEVLVEAAKCLDNEESFARVVYPLVKRLSGAPLSPRQDGELSEPTEPESPEYEGEAEIGYGQEQQPDNYSRIGNYAIFRTKWDECEAARVWHLPEDAEALRTLNALDRQKIRKLAHELQRRLFVQRLRHWNFELEEGMLDSRKLAALVGERPDHRIFKYEREAQIPEACVTLLVDQSGSMRGSAHLLAAQAIDVAVHTLEVCGIAVEVLGYTTRHGVDNPIVRIWRKAGSPAQPGRLNALRHIILKAAGQPWRVARRNLGLLLRPDFGRENIDGESLHWAARRLMARPERRKILFVISDGSPYDEATVQNNDSRMLTDHLQAVVDAVERTSIHLIGIGTGRGVGRYYKNAATVRREDMIGEVLFGMLGESFDQPKVPGRRGL